jgi:hypothetical protein
MALTYTQWLAANRLPATSQNAATWLATAAPAGSPIPSALRQYFGGAARTGGQQTGTGSNYLPSPLGTPAGPDPLAAAAQAIAGLPAAAAPTTTPPPLPVPDPSSDPTLQGIMAQWQGLPGLYTPPRAIAAGPAAAALGDYSDTPVGMTAVGAPGADQAYSLSVGAPGLLYRQGAMNDIYGAASGGDVGSSALQNSLQDTQRTLNEQAQQIWNQWYGNQQASLSQELADRSSLAGQWGTALGNWQQNQTGIAGSSATPGQLTTALNQFQNTASPSQQGIGSSIGATPTTAKTPAQTTPTADWQRTSLSPRTLSTRAPSPFQSHWSFSGWGKT